MKRLDIFLVLVVTSTWGVAFVGIKEVIADSPPITVAGLRFVLGGLLLLPLAMRRRQGRQPAVRELVVIGLLQTTGLYGLGFLGVERTTAGASSLLINTNPVMVAFLAVPFLKERLRLSAVVGLALSVVGITLISVRSGLGTPLGVALCLLSAASWAAASIAIKRVEGADLVALNCGQMLIGGLPLLFLGAAAEQRMPRFDATSWLWFAFLVVVATAFNFVLWFRLLDRHGAVAMSSWLFLIPVFGVVSGAVLLDEPVGWRLIAGGALVVVGVMLAQDRSPQAPPVVEAPG